MSSLDVPCYDNNTIDEFKKKCTKDLKSIKARGADEIKSEMLATVNYKTLNNLLSLQ